MPIEPHSLGYVKYKGEDVPYTKQELLDKLKKCDTDQNGMYSKDEIKLFFHNLGSRYPPYRVNRAFKLADIDGSGTITHQELDLLVDYIIRCNYKRT
ncbi:hypothetical protein M5689_016666 [Euphorbia peplus]|nr:hypothetical protein M5689_016666 [Euphorbia peplus]